MRWVKDSNMWMNSTSMNRLYSPDQYEKFKPLRPEISEPDIKLLDSRFHGNDKRKNENTI